MTLMFPKPAPPRSLEQELGLWIVAEFFVRLWQLFLITIVVLAIVGVIAAAPGAGVGGTILLIVLVLVLAAVELWIIVVFEAVPWVHLTRYRLRRYEEATAQRGATVTMRSRDLNITYPAFGQGAPVFVWLDVGGILTPEEADRLPRRPDSWTRPVSTDPPLLLAWQDRLIKRAAARLLGRR